MAKVLFKRRTTAEIEDLEVEDGALIYNTDNGKTYMDFEEERIQTGGNADTIIARQTTEPTDEDIKLWINPDKLAETEASNVVDSMEGTQTDKSPSVNAVKNYVDKNVYSTTETVIGTWDDKPLYRKRYDLTTITFGNYATINLDSTYSVKKYEAYIQRNNNRLDKYATGAGSDQASLTSSIRTSGIELWTSNTYSSGFEKVYVIIEYTKTTD